MSEIPGAEEDSGRERTNDAICSRIYILRR